MKQPEWMLTDEEFEEAIDKKILYPDHMIDIRTILKAQARKLIEWLFQECGNKTHVAYDDNVYIDNKDYKPVHADCRNCMEQLKKEVQGG